MNRRQPYRNHLSSFVVLTALGAVSVAGCQKGGDEAKPGTQGGTPAPQTAAPQPAAQAVDLSPLIQAMQKADTAKATELIASGTNVNVKDAQGRTALIYAAGDNDRTSGSGFGGGQKAPGGSDALVSLLLSHHADPNATAQDGTTAVLAAISHKKVLSGPPDVAGSQQSRINKVRMLLAAGAKVNVATSAENGENLRAGSTPLMAAAINGYPPLIKMLLAKGAEVNAKDQAGNTALIDAARLGNADAVQLLLVSHADVNVRNAKGGTALSEASRMKTSGLAKCADLLRSAGAKG